MVSICVSRKVGWADGPRGRFEFPGAEEQGKDCEVCSPLARRQGCCSTPHPELGTGSSSASPPLHCLLGQMR